MVPSVLKSSKAPGMSFSEPLEFIIMTGVPSQREAGFDQNQFYGHHQS